MWANADSTVEVALRDIYANKVLASQTFTVNTNGPVRNAIALLVLHHHPSLAVPTAGMGLHLAALQLHAHALGRHHVHGGAGGI